MLVRGRDICTATEGVMGISGADGAAEMGGGARGCRVIWLVGLVVRGWF